MQKQLLNQRLDFPLKEKIKTIYRLAIILGQHTVKITVRFSSWRTDKNYGEIGYNPKPKNCWNSGWIFQEKKRRKLWIAWQ